MTKPDVLQPAQVVIRHVRQPALSNGAYDGPQTTVLGMAFVGSEYGVNGRRGWQSADEDGRLQEDGTLTIVFPNAVGEDGIRHMDRFACFTQANYEVGDEWIEVYRKTGPGGGDALFVGSPADWEVSNSTISIVLADAWWCQNLMRDTAAGFHIMGPRDLWEQYSRATVMVWADDFQPGTLNEVTWSGSWQTTANNEYAYVLCHRGANGVVINPRTVSSRGRLQVAKTIPIGPSSSDRHSWWRAEARMQVHRFVNQGTGSEFGITLRDGVNGGDPIQLVIGTSGSLIAYSDFGGAPPRYTVITDALSQFNVTLATGANDGYWGTWHFAIEGRGRWLFFYVNGRLVHVSPMTVYATNTDLNLCAHIQTSDNQPDARAEVTEMEVRRSMPYLLRGANKGDYRIPGSPAARGLKVKYFEGYNDNQRWGSARWHHFVGRPALSEPVAEQTETAINYPDVVSQGRTGATSVPDWLPAGVRGDWVMGRWVGSIYLDLDNYDYRFRVTNDDIARLWIGQTRWGEQLFDDWPATYAGHSMAAALTKWVKAGNNPALGTAPSGTSGPLNGQKSGWYPLIAEWANGGGSGGFCLEYIRSDKPGSPIVAGEGDLPHVILGDNPSVYWKMGEGESVSAVLTDYSGNAQHGTYTGNGTTATRQGLPGPIPGALSTHFDGSGSGYGSKASVPTQISSVDGYSWSYEVILRAQATYGAGARGIPFSIGDAASANRGFGLWVQPGNVLSHWVWGDAEPSGGLGTAVLTALQWYHVVVTYDHPTQTTKIYVDGVLNASRTAAGGQKAYTGGNSPSVSVGRLFSPTGARDYWNGRLAHFALYGNKALSAADVTKRYNLFRAGPSLGLGSPLSPIGIIEQEGTRFESYYEGLKSILDGFGLQARCEPRTLESGEFPGQLVPKVRVGRDTNYYLDEDEAVNISVRGSARDSVTHLIGDAQGLGDALGVSGLAVEDFNTKDSMKHLFLHSAMESLGDMTSLEHVLQRLSSLMLLRSSPWEEVSAQPAGKKSMVDSFPLSASTAPSEFDWGPGDSIFLRQPRIGVVDQTPRQILGRARKLYPDGFGEYMASFRQRPRSTKEILRRALRQFAINDRNFQGQIVVLTGSIGAHSSTAGSDRYSRVGLPANLKSIRRAWLNVLWLGTGGTTDYTIEVNGVSTGMVVPTSRGEPYDVTAWAKRATTAPLNENRLYATLLSGDRGYEVQLAVEVVI